MATNTQYFSLQGKLHIGKRLPNGSLGALRWAENCPKFDLTIETEEESIKESWSGQKLEDLILEKSKTVKVALSLHGFSPDNVAMGFYSKLFKRVAGTVTNEPLPADLKVGDYFKLDKPNTSSIVLTDSTASPVTLVVGTHYRIDSQFGGIGELISVSGITQPIKGAYSYAESNALPLFTQRPEEVWLVFDGKNTTDGSSVLIDLYRTKFKPAASLPIINNEGVGTIDLEGSVLLDGGKVADPTLGGFGRMVFKGTT
ncbi:hypothetical protein [Lysobacter sp. CA199]|uniref:phage tail tube protein n=1 Tax=Lysobacter sp. CA199 TaxID=3455608 RepID=UPI003F8D44B2